MSDYPDIKMDVRFRRPQTSPDRAKVCMQQMNPRVAVNKPTMKKLQIVYYLSRNGHLEHPHFMEINHLPHQPLRLRDVMDRLTALRGNGMPSLYSWSCKRSYKNGYVWNDLAENDIIYPAEGAEYVLKGSELVEGCSERLNQNHITSSQQIQDSSFGSKRRTSPLALTPNRGHDHDQYDDQEEEEVDYEDEKTSYTSSTTPHSRCSRGVSTDELEEQHQPQTHKTQVETPHPQSSPLPNASILVPDQSNRSNNASILVPDQSNRSNNVSTRFEDGDPITSKQSNSVSKTAQSRNSVLLQLIACGSSAVAKAKNPPCVKQVVVKRERTSGDSFRKEVLYKSAVKIATEDEDMINYMSENPRFGNLQSEEKEYFSGSIVESIKEDERVHSAEPVLKKSNSYNEERSTKVGLGVVTVEEEEEKRDKAAVRGKCIPRKFSSAASSKQPRK